MGTTVRRGRFEPLAEERLGLLRPRLLGALGRRFDAAVVAVVAPAGFGKTTLLAQAVGENRLDPRGHDAWLTCNADDAAASSLADGLHRALVSPQPASSTALAGGTAGIAGSAGDPASGPAITSAVDAVVEAMWHRSPEQVALLLDDVHEIPRGSGGAELLEALVAALPRNGHLVLAGRVALPVALARLEVSGELVRLGEEDLAFTDEELTEFAARRGVPRRRIAGSGGWPALAELAASASASPGSVAPAEPGEPGESAESVEAAYLWEEVLARIPPERRRDLALLMHVGAFDDGLAAAVVGHDVDLQSLTADLPLVGRSPDGARSIHPLWRPFLAREVGPQAIALARQRAGVTLAEAGDVAAAVRLLAEAGASAEVTRVVTDALGAAHPPVPGDVVAGWLGHLPDGLHDGPLARLLGAVGAVQGDPEAAVHRLEEAMDAFRRAGELGGELACIAQLAQIAWWWEQPAQMLTVATRLMELESTGHRPVVPLASLARALVADVANDCGSVLDQLARIPPGAFNQTWESLVDWLRSTCLNHLGRPVEALEAAERACAHPGPVHAPLVDSARLQARWFLGHVDEVLRELPPLVERTASSGLANYTALMAATCCIALALAGRPDQAASYLERARRTGASHDVPLVDVNLAIAEAALSVARGDEPAAATTLHDYMGRSQLLGAGHAAAPQQRTLALWYVLVPASRPVWDEAPLGPCFAEARALARALVRIREGATTARPAVELPEPGIVRAHLPLPWATELALAEIDAGRQDGWQLLDGIWPAAQPHVRRHASAPASGTRGLDRPAKVALTRLPVPPRGRLELRLLGPLELRRDGEPVAGREWGRERVRLLLAHLVLHRGASRERLGEDLWPGMDAEAQSRNLRVTLTHLLRAIEPDRRDRDASFLVRPHGGSLLLEDGEHFGADVWSFDELWDRATDADRRRAPSAALTAMLEAIRLWRGDPSELAAEEWALTAIEERRIRLVTMACRAGELLLAKGEPDQARQVAVVALDADPWSEAANRTLVNAHRMTGDDTAARTALQRYRAALEELGTPPAELTRKLTDLTGGRT